VAGASTERGRRRLDKVDFRGVASEDWRALLFFGLPCLGLRSWLVRVEAEVPGTDFRGFFLLPVYPRR
jgi:hypothetical protein